MSAGTVFRKVSLAPNQQPRPNGLNLTHKIQKFNRKGEKGEKGMKYLGFSLFFSAA
jgi:hypothetical protein